MSLSSYLWGIRFFTCVTLFAWLGIVFFLDPNETGIGGAMLFSISLFIFLTGIFLLFAIWLYRIRLGDMGTIHHLSGSFRQAVLLSLYGMGILFFQYTHILLWWDALLLLATLLLIEFSYKYFSHHKEE